MARLIPLLLAIHVAAGTLALVVAPVAMLTAKGGPAHRRWGRVYYWAMGVVALTALVVALWRPNPFLAMVAVFSYYFAFTGRGSSCTSDPTAASARQRWTGAPPWRRRRRARAWSSSASPGRGRCGYSSAWSPSCSAGSGWRLPACSSGGSRGPRPTRGAGGLPT